MDKEVIVQVALENLELNTGLTGKFMPNEEQTHIDGQIDLELGNKEHTFLIEVKKEVRQLQMAQLAKNHRESNQKFMIVAEYIFPSAKKELIELNIPYIDVNGNVHIKVDDNLIWVELQKPRKVKENRNRAFTPTGLQLVFEILLHPMILDLTQREIADKTKVGLGQVNNVLNGLQLEGYLIKKDKKKLVLRRQEELFEKWIIGYSQRLKPKIKIGNYRFVKTEDFQDWPDLKLKEDQTFWGGEPAGNLLTAYLYPKVLSIYTNENRQELIKNYKMVPDNNGNIEVFTKFWYSEWRDHRTVPVELVYADLIESDDKRCRETAQRLYDDQIKNKLIGRQV